MGALAYSGCMCSGHGGFPSRTCDSGSPTVFTNGKPVAGSGAHWVTHSDGHSSHDGVLIGGSAKVFVNGQPAGRIGDQISCGSIVAQGSSNVFAS